MPFTPTPTLPLKGEGVVGVLDGFLSLRDQESFLRFVGRIVPALAGLIRHEKWSAHRRVNSAEAETTRPTLWFRR